METLTLMHLKDTLSIRQKTGGGEAKRKPSSPLPPLSVRVVSSREDAGELAINGILERQSRIY